MTHKFVKHSVFLKNLKKSGYIYIHRTDSCVAEQKLTHYKQTTLQFKNIAQKQTLTIHGQLIFTFKQGFYGTYTCKRMEAGLIPHRKLIQN